ncbi:MAG: antiviral reverse transcriptase Drt3a [Candidatus Sedimenticola sp. PURPLELP]
MLDQSINEESLAFAISPTERYKYKTEFSAGDEVVISRCIDFYNSDNDFPNLIKSVAKGKTAYQTNDVVSDILIRRLNVSLKTINQVKQQDRNAIIKSVIALLKEKHKYSLLRLDIKSFYESIDRKYIISLLERDPAYSVSTLEILKRLDSCFESSMVSGVPRGLSISATLSEYLMRKFDKNIRNLSGVFFYARFVDDILIISCHDPEDISKLATKYLPDFLKFGDKKGKRNDISINHFNKHNAGQKGSFEYLGYKFTIIDDKNSGRIVSTDIADSKVNKIKTRTIKALLDYEIKKDFNLLKKRIRLMTSNFYLFNRYRSTKVRSGIYYNYRYVSEINNQESNLYNLDRFLCSILFCKSHSSAFSASGLSLTSNQKKELAKLSFVNGHRDKIFHRFTIKQMKKIKKCWR